MVRAANRGPLIGSTWRRVVTRKRGIPAGGMGYGGIMNGYHLKRCVVEAVAQGGEQAQEKVREATAAISRLVRS